MPPQAPPKSKNKRGTCYPSALYMSHVKPDLLMHVNTICQHMCTKGSNDSLNMCSHVASSPGSSFFLDFTRGKGSLVSDVTCVTYTAPYTKVGRVASGENCPWVRTIFELFRSKGVRRKATLIVSEGSTMLINPSEPRYINQRCKIGLKWTLCGERCTTPFCHRLSHDFRCQALSRFFPASEKS